MALSKYRNSTEEPTHRNNNNLLGGALKTILGRKNDQVQPDIAVYDKSRNSAIPPSLDIKKRELLNRTF